MSALSERVGPWLPALTSAAAVLAGLLFLARHLRKKKAVVTPQQESLAVSVRKAVAMWRVNSSSRIKHVQVQPFRFGDNDSGAVVDLAAPNCRNREHVGGKAASLADLVASGVPVPEAVCVTMAAFDAHVAPFADDVAKISAAFKALQAITADTDNVWDTKVANSASDHVRFDNVRIEKQLHQLRAKVVAQPLDAAVLARVMVFVDQLPTNATVAVRSSASSEDTLTSAAAGQFLTTLNVAREAADVEHAIKEAFASVFEPHVLSLYNNLATVRMAVLVQRQVVSRASGIVFTGNPVTRNPAQIVVEAAWGQGHGVVSGEITPRRSIYKHGSFEFVSETAIKQDKMYELQDGQVKLVPVDDALANVSCLDKATLEVLLRWATVIHVDRGDLPQDIEFCTEVVNGNIQMYIVQARPCTTKMESAYTFEPPGPGPWETDVAHFPRALTLFMQSYFPDCFKNGFQAGFKKYGILLDHVEAKMVNGIWYQRSRAVGAPPAATGPPPYPIFKLLTWFHPLVTERLATSRKAAAEQLWLKDKERWDNEWKPKLLAKNRELQAKDASKMTDEELINHLDATYAHLLDCMHYRFVITPAVLVPMGDLLASTAEMHKAAGQPYVANDVLLLLGQYSRLQNGITVSIAKDISRAFQNDDAALRLLFDAKVPDDEKLNRFLKWVDFGSVKETVHSYVYDWGAGMRLINGMDIDGETGFEHPEVLIGGIQEMVKHGRNPGTTEPGTPTANAAHPVDPLAAVTAYAARLREQDRATFMQLMEHAAQMNSVREERGLLTDAWVVGIARHLYLEIGRRLVARGKLTHSMFIFEAEPKKEVRQLLLNDPEQPSESILRQRRQMRQVVTAADAPKTLGPNTRGPPPLDWLPADSRRMERGIRTALSFIWTARSAQKPTQSENEMRGEGSSSGCTVGTAVVVTGINDLGTARFKRGNILVTVATTAAFNIVLPMLAGIVAESGGILSHASIVARERNIPAIVGVRDATKRIRTGDLIEVNGSSGIVTIRRKTTPTPMRRTGSKYNVNLPAFMLKFTMQNDQVKTEDYSVPMYVLKPDELPPGVETYTMFNQRWAAALEKIERYPLDRAWLMEAFSLTPEQLEAQRGLFVRHDLQKKGFLDAEGLKEFFEHMGQRRSIDDVNLIFKEWDIDGDGRCTFAEWVTIVNGMPSRLAVNLFLGNMYNAQSVNVIESLGITHIVNVAPSRAKSVFRDRGITYLEINVEDDDKADIAQHLPSFCEFVDEARADPKNRVLVHCTMGMSRSSSLMIGYFMLTKRWTLSEAYFFVKAARRMVSPNTSFLRQLLRLANETAASQSTDAELLQTKLRQDMVKSAFRVNDQVLGSLQKLFALLADKDYHAITAQTVDHFHETILGIRRPVEAQFNREFGAAFKTKYWDIMGSCYVTFPMFVASLKGLPALFLPHVYVGTNFVVKDMDVMSELGITGSVDCSLQRNIPADSSISSVHVPIDDSVVLEGQELDELLEPAFAAIDEAIASNDQQLLIHDPIGMPKISLLCVCYLMKRRKWSLGQATYFATSRVRCVTITDIWAIYHTTVNYALFLNPNDVIPNTGIFVFADKTE